jgi:Tol biopolymer transport system component
MRSALCTFDIGTGRESVILETPELIEAPNWTPDGLALIVNGDGRLYRVDLGRPGLALIDTGFAIRLNNDHGVSPDGHRLVISNHTVPGQSCIYTLPISGGEPERVTANTPSWWHGWSPDGQRLAYAAVRDGVFDIYTIPVRGGDETRLTEGGGHHDGPDYTPDGDWIWFNSDVGGSMQLWRMRTDGRDRQRMTDDARVNWFPHPSPDGQHVVYLSYPSGIAGHPSDKDVELRLMPAGGGSPATLIQLFGGQGTINVPSWSPRSNAFAYVRYFPLPGSPGRPGKPVVTG